MERCSRIGGGRGRRAEGGGDRDGSVENKDRAADRRTRRRHALPSPSEDDGSGSSARSARRGASQNTGSRAVIGGRGRRHVFERGRRAVTARSARRGASQKTQDRAPLSEDEVDPGPQGLSAQSSFAGSALAATRPEAKLRRLGRLDHGVPRQVSGTNQPSVVAEAGEHQPGFLAEASPVSVRLKARCAGSKSRSPAALTPPPMTTTSGSTAAAMLAIPCPSQVPTSASSSTEVGSP